MEKDNHADVNQKKPGTYIGQDSLKTGVRNKEISEWPIPRKVEHFQVYT